MPSPDSPIEAQPGPESPRAEYQKGLLAWLKAPEEKACLDVMLHALNAQRAQHDAAPETIACFAAAEALLTAIRDQRLEPLVPYRRLAARVEQALRKGTPDRTLRADLQAPLLQFDPPLQAPIEPLQARDPLSAALAPTAAVLPLLATPREPRFTTAQRSLWDNAVEALGLAWTKCSGTTAHEGWAELRQGIFRLLEGALTLGHPAPLQLAEALAAATDDLESASPSPRLLTTLAASMELLQERGFLEHEALESLVRQLATRLERRDEGTRSRHLDILFAHEAREEIERLRLAMEALPPDCKTLQEAARRIQQLADPLDLAPLTLVAFRFAQSVEQIDPARLDHPPGRDIALSWIDALENWITAIGDSNPLAPPAELAALQTQLSSLAETGAR
ncbi:MAG: hypothetical protein LBQ81_00480 [Zoogloeaceae bacterium]|jgi:hypothetical protein|nr:hypothetical protein [Zoogloeaceae bacterium]